MDANVLQKVDSDLKLSHRESHSESFSDRSQDEFMIESSLNRKRKHLGDMREEEKRETQIEEEMNKKRVTNHSEKGGRTRCINMLTYNTIVTLVFYGFFIYTYVFHQY